MKEEWRPVVGYDGYTVSNYGQVKSYKVRPEGKLMKPYKRKDGGHLRVGLVPAKCMPGHVTDIQTIVALAFLGERPPGNVVRHLDGNPENNRLDNLAYGTAVDNHEDAVAHGTKTGRCLFEDEQYLLFVLNGLGYTGHELGDIFGITHHLAYKTIKVIKRSEHCPSVPRSSDYRRMASQIHQ